MSTHRDFITYLSFSYCSFLVLDHPPSIPARLFHTAQKAAVAAEIERHLDEQGVLKPCPDGKAFHARTVGGPYTMKRSLMQ